MKNNKKDKSNLAQLAGYYKRYKFLSIAVFILSITYALVGLLSPIYEGKLLGQFENFDKTQIIKTAIFLMILRLIIEIIVYIWTNTVLKLNAKVSYDLKRNTLDSITNIETKDFDETNSGIFISRLDKDTNELSKLFDNITDSSSEIILNVGFIVYVLFINIYLGIFLVFNVIINYILTTKQLTCYKKAKLDYVEKDEKVIGTYTDIIRGIREIKNLNLKSTFIPKVNIMQKETIKADTKRKYTKLYWNRIIYSTQHVLDFTFILLSIYFITTNQLALSSFTIVFLYKNKVLNLTKYVSDLRGKLADGKISASRVFDIINYDSYQKEHYGNKKAEKLEGKIIFKNVNFTYNDSELFENLNLELTPNKMIAFVGKSGEGKSTILKLISKNYNINGGQILIDGYDLDELSEESLRNNISIVSQSPYIFNLSIKENIKLVNENATDEEVIEVCKEAQIHDDIIGMVNGYDTVVGENGTILSGGQKQRVAIARALIKKTNIILFDEATSALDNNNQEKIKNVIRDLSKNHTIIVVAHRLSTIVDSDYILVLDKHKICASGTHNDLINNCKEYKKLYEIEE